MKKFLSTLLIFSSLLFAPASIAQKDQSEQATVSFNLGEFAAFTILSLTTFKDISCTKGATGPYPFHIDASFLINDQWAIDSGFVYRFEDYNCPSGTSERRDLWTKYSELFFMGGIRYSPLSTGLDGLYLSAKAGPGFGFSGGGYAFTLVVQPEVGYAWNFFGPPGLHLKLGLGLLANLPIVENPRLGWDRLNFFPGYVVHRLIPIINVGIGMSF